MIIYSVLRTTLLLLTIISSKFEDNEMTNIRLITFCRSHSLKEMTLGCGRPMFFSTVFLFIARQVDSLLIWLKILMRSKSNDDLIKKIFNSNWAIQSLRDQTQLIRVFIHIFLSNGHWTSTFLLEYFSTALGNVEQKANSQKSS